MSEKKKISRDRLKKHAAKPASTASQKETIYVDAEDDITSLISELKATSKSVIAIILPKNAHVLQSIVNMKLLKKAATKNKKNIALITTDPSIMTLAGVAGIHVAETANSKPSIPTVSVEDVDTEEPDVIVSMASVVTAAALDEKPDVKQEKQPEKTSKSESSSDSKTSLNEEESQDGNDSSEEDGDEKIEVIQEKNKRFKVPDFGAFQVRLLIGFAIAIMLVTLWFIGFVVMPKAEVRVVTNTENVPLKSTVTLTYTEDSEVDAEDRVLPAMRVTTEKTSETSQPATGEKNIGEKASGTVTMSAQVCGSFSVPSAVPSGTGVSVNGKTYITQDRVTFSPDSISGGCLNFNGGDTDIVAQDSGESFNQPANTDFDVAGRSDVSAVGSASGGTTEIVKVVSDGDVENAKKLLGDGARGEALQELKQQLSEQGYEALDLTLTIEDPVFTVSPKAGEEGDSVTVKQTIKYTLSGYRNDDLRIIVDAVLSDTLTTENEEKNIANNGFDDVVFATGDGADSFQMSTIAVIGPSLNEEVLKEEFVGKKRGEIIDRLESIDGVKSAEVSYSPMWITTTPKSSKKITITIDAQ